MIDPATGWFEMQQIKNKTAAEVHCGREAPVVGSGGPNRDPT
jgi:hypothetical protein